jgi:ion channel-forming bestrophin family protein
MIYSDEKNVRWFARAFNIRYSVLPKIWCRLLIVVCFGFVVSWLFNQGYNVSLPVLGSIVPNIILGLLLVFRTNTAYDRYWEGRKLWGKLVTNIRNFTRVVVSNPNISSTQKTDLLSNLIQFVIISKDMLFGEIDTKVLRPTQLKMLNPNINELQLLQNKLSMITNEGSLDMIEYDNLTIKLDNLASIIGGCQRIVNTPIPLAYSIHIKQLILIYSLTVPFQFVGQLGWWTPLITFVICYALMGIEEIGLEIENPFGRDHNDLELNKFVTSVRAAIEEASQ